MARLAWSERRLNPQLAVDRTTIRANILGTMRRSVLVAVRTPAQSR